MSSPINISLTKKVVRAVTQGRGLRGYGVIVDLSDDGMIQWRQDYTGAQWNDIIAIADLKGDKGDNSHIHIKWHSEGSETLLDTADKYIGIYVDNEIEDSAVFADYTWYLWKGDKGDQGNPAPNTIWQFSADGEAWSTTVPEGVIYMRESSDGGTTWSDAIEMPTVAALNAKVTQTITNGVQDKAPSEDAVFDALALKAPLASPALTGTPTAPTATVGTNNTQVANTAFVENSIREGDPV